MEGKLIKSVDHRFSCGYDLFRIKVHERTSPEIQNTVMVKVSRRVSGVSNKTPWWVLQDKIKREVMGRRGRGGDEETSK